MIGQYEFNEWARRVADILDKIEIPWEIHLLNDKIFKDENDNGRLYLQVQFDETDNDTGKDGYRAYCRKWYLSPYMTTQEIVRTAWLAYKGAVDHEAAEKFRYCGKMINGPHVSPDALLGIADERDVRLEKAETT